jgi:hypothetical protein
MNLQKHIWEGWTVQCFIDDLELIFQFQPKFERKEVKEWCMYNQPYYKKYIKEVVDYFWEKNQEKFA